MRVLTLGLRPKMTRRSAAALVLAAGALLCAVILLAGRRDAAETFGGEVSGKNIKTQEDRVDFIGRLGWQADPDSETVQDVVIPSEFNETLLAYNQLQLTQGCDLTRYAGKRVKRYSYEIKNYPSGEEGVKVSILIYKNTVIGGDICSTRLDGFMHGLTVD